MKKITKESLFSLIVLIQTLVNTTKSNITSAYEALVGALGNDSEGNPYTVKGYVDNAVSNAASAGAVVIKEISEGLADGILKAYEFYQGGEEAINKIGTINLPKDLVVKDGDVVVLTENEIEGLEAGTYIKLIIANDESKPIYVPADKLVKDFTVAQNAPIIQLAVSANREISATIVDGGVSTEKLAANAVTEEKLGLSTTNLNEGETSISILESRARGAEKTAANYTDAQIAAIPAWTEAEIQAVWDEVFNPKSEAGE